MKDCMQPTSLMEKLSTVLSGINKLKKGGVSTHNEKNRKNLNVLTALKTRTYL